MADGKLYRFVEEHYRGDVVYAYVLPNTVIGGLMPSRETIPISLIHPLRDRLSRALLEIGVVVPHENIKWRVKVNGIPLTREFRPHAVSPSGNKLFAKLVFDVTSILKTPESIRKRRVNVTFKTEGGEQILIEHIGLLAMFDTDEAVSDITYISGALSLKPGEETELGFKYYSDKGIFHGIIYMPSGAAEARIMVNDKEFYVSGLQGMDELVWKLEGLRDNNVLKVIHEATDTTYYPKEMRLSSIILLNQVYKEPDIEITSIDIPEKLESGGKIKVELTNSGETSPDKILLVLMSLGNVITRKKVDNIGPGKSLSIELPVELPKGEYDLVLRVIWGKLSRTWFKDERIHLVIG